MLFHEIYGSYYNVIAAVLTEALSEDLNAGKIRKIIQEKAFDESILNIPEKLQENWALLTPDYKTRLQNPPTMPLTTLQKRWLKALLMDPRIQLFFSDITEQDELLSDVTPLFTPEQIVYFDRNTDGDPYTDPAYIARFHIILEALKKELPLKITYLSPRNQETERMVFPQYLEYSSNDDKFRLQTTKQTEKEPANGQLLNLSRIQTCEIIADKKGTFHRQHDWIPSAQSRTTVTMVVNDERNAMERVLLHLSSYERQAKQLSDHTYEIQITYDRAEETDILIRILSFGPYVRVTAPEPFVKKIRMRLQNQLLSGKGLC